MTRFLISMAGALALACGCAAPRTPAAGVDLGSAPAACATKGGCCGEAKATATVVAVGDAAAPSGCCAAKKKSACGAEGGGCGEAKGQCPAGGDTCTEEKACDNGGCAEQPASKP